VAVDSVVAGSGCCAVALAAFCAVLWLWPPLLKVLCLWPPSALCCVSGCAPLILSQTHSISHNTNAHKQMYNIPKRFDMERGDFRIFILDNHRPVHLANIHSRHQVVVFDDESEILEDEKYTKGEVRDAIFSAFPSHCHCFRFHGAFALLSILHRFCIVFCFLFALSHCFLCDTIYKHTQAIPQ
jgi:hypothetical protein